MMEKRLLYIFLIKCGDAVSKINIVVKMFSGVVIPSAVGKWSHYDCVFCFWIVLFNCFINVQWTSQIFGVKPTTDRHYGVLDIFEMRQQISFFPIVIVVWVRHYFLHKEVVFVIFVHTFFQSSHILVK
ncbi:hypothetical protein D3C86_1700170 [compost metagenome]